MYDHVLLIPEVQKVPGIHVTDGLLHVICSTTECQQYLVPGMMQQGHYCCAAGSAWSNHCCTISRVLQDDKIRELLVRLLYPIKVVEKVSWKKSV